MVEELPFSDMLVQQYCGISVAVSVQVLKTA